MTKHILLLLTMIAAFCVGTTVSPVVAAPGAAAPSGFSDCPDCPRLVRIPPGSIGIGSSPAERDAAGTPAMFGDREGPVVTVRVKGFALGATEITRGQYAAFVAATKRADPADCGVHDAAKDAWGPKAGFNWHNPGFPQTDGHPAVCVSYDDATAYAAWLSSRTGHRYRLPSEAEFEYAARAGTRTAWYWGDAAETGCDKANLLSTGGVLGLGSPPSIANRTVCVSPRSFTTPVASFAPNPFGLYDIIGNAFEWVADCYADSHATTPVDGSALVQPGCSRHYLKGGAFHTPLWLTRSASRGNPIPAYLHMFTIGFRVARDLE